MQSAHNDHHSFHFALKELSLSRHKAGFDFERSATQIFSHDFKQSRPFPLQTEIHVGFSSLGGHFQPENGISVAGCTHAGDRKQEPLHLPYGESAV